MSGIVAKVVVATIVSVVGSMAICYGTYWLLAPDMFGMPMAMIMPIVTPAMIAPLVAGYYLRLMNTIERQNAELIVARGAAEEADRRKRVFLADVSHELRTPLNAIIGFSEVIASRGFGPIDDKYIEYTDDINGAGRHLLSVIDDLLDVSKIEAGRFTQIPEIVSVAGAAADAARLCRADIEQGGVALELSGIAEGATVYADPRVLTQILVNLIGNAAKYAGVGAAVRVETSAGGEPVVTVTDTGVGMTKAELSEARRYFGRARAADAGKGSGLGLPLVEKLMELSDGRFTIKSEPGVGTTVSLSFPPPGAAKNL